MRTCRAVDILSRILPFRAWKGDILERHMDRCPACQTKLAGSEEARAYVIRPETSEPSDSIWPAVEARIRAKSPTPVRRAPSFGRLWKRTAGLAAVAGVLVLIFFVSRPPRPAGTALPDSPADDFRLDSVEAWGRPAQALVYQARDSRITIIWVR
jgi:hypothetical protein